MDRPFRPSLDLPVVLPMLLAAATWEFLLLRIVVPVVSRGAGDEASNALFLLGKLGFFSLSLTAFLAVFVLGATVVGLLRDGHLGPLTHRITVSGFSAIVVLIGAVAILIPVGRELSLLTHAAAIFLSGLLVMGLLWQKTSKILLLGAVLLLLPTILRFYASCAIAVPMLRVESPVPLYAYQGAEVVAVVTAWASPFLFAGLKPRQFMTKPPLVAIFLSGLPAVAFSAALVGSGERVIALCHRSVGFSFDLLPAQVLYPLALFAFLLAATSLILPPTPTSAGPSHGEQRIGYGLVLLFLAGLDSLDGTVQAVISDPEDIPELVAYLLEGNWSQLDAEQQTLIGPPLRDIYQVILVALSYVLIARGIQQSGDDS